MFRLDTGSEADFARTTEMAVATGGFPRPRAMLLAVAGPPVGKRAELSNAEVAGGRLTVDGDALAAALGLEQGSSSMISSSVARAALPRAAGCGPAGRGADALRSACADGRGGAWYRARRRRPRPGRWTLAAGFRRGRACDARPGDAGRAPLLAASRWPGALGRGSRVGAWPVAALPASAASLGVVAQDDAAPAVAERALAGTEPAAADAVRRLFLLLARLAGTWRSSSARGVASSSVGGSRPSCAACSTRRPSSKRSGAVGRGVGFLLPIPVRMILAADAALIGLASVARRPELFALDYAARRWR